LQQEGSVRGVCRREVVAHHLHSKTEKMMKHGGKRRRNVRIYHLRAA
jgi:hypothetical protein